MKTKRISTYKPLSFGTAIRNPERFKDFLHALYKHDQQILTDEIIAEVVHYLTKHGIYTTRYVMHHNTLKQKVRNNEILSDEETIEIIDHSPQNHKEAGFSLGWPSRFDTWYRLAKELGFVYYEMGKPIELSKAGVLLASAQNMQITSSVFLNAFVKYQRNNPFRRILNSNSPLILLLKTIIKLNQDNTYNDLGISRKEIPILLCWRDDDADALYKQIKKLRNGSLYS